MSGLCSAKIAYTVSMVGFSIITCYMSFCAIYLAVTGIQAFENQGNVTAEDVISDSTFRNIILSLAATYGIYLLASLLAFDPWHMCKCRATSGGSGLKADVAGRQSRLCCNI